MDKGQTPMPHPVLSVTQGKSRLLILARTSQFNNIGTMAKALNPRFKI